MFASQIKNRQHALDAAIGAWQRTAKGVYENYDGWKIEKCANGWAVVRPNGSTVNNLAYPSLFEAKYQVATTFALEV